MAIVSHEDISVSDVNQQKPFGIDFCFENFTIERNLLILRDFKNFIASRYMHSKKNNACKSFKEDRHVSCKQWKQYAQEYLQTTIIVENTYFILFDSWFQDKQYRKDICEDLELEFTDEGINNVLDYGKGSSFDGVRFDNHAQKMNVLDRYGQVQDEHLVKTTIEEYKDCVELSKEIFGEIISYEI